MGKSMLVTFNLYVGGFQELSAKLKEGKLDCIFTSKYIMGNLPCITLGKDELMLVTSKDHPLANKFSVSLSDVNGQDFIMSADNTDYETGELFRIHQIQPNVRFHINEDYTVVKMVEQGFGIAILPKLLLLHIPFDVCVRPFTEHCKRILVVAHSPSAEPTPALKQFMEFAALWSQEHQLLI